MSWVPTHSCESARECVALQSEAYRLGREDERVARGQANGDPPVNLSMTEIGYLHAIIWDRAAQGDHVARGLFDKLKAAAIARGAVWYYGDPWRKDPPP